MIQLIIVLVFGFTINFLIYYVLSRSESLNISILVKRGMFVVSLVPWVLTILIALTSLLVCLKEFIFWVVKEIKNLWGRK